MSRDADIASGRLYFTTIGAELARRADKHNDAVSALLDKVMICAMLADLPGDGALRARLFPNVFDLQA